ncbi:signal transduction histidine kinase [Pedobacter sp. UYP30]|uniref:PAS domain-containing sensor histidine kinase n=1 Tax=Pedobacter sp. UYP30 TaxID=1756400 RepID=UPI003399BBEA
MPKTDSLANANNDTAYSKFANFFDFAPLGYFILDGLWRITEINQMALAKLNVGKKEALESVLTDFISEDDRESVIAMLKSLELAEEKKVCCVKIQPRNGKAIHTLIEGLTRRRLAAGKPEYYITLTDITETKVGEQRLKTVTQRLNQILRASTAGTWSIYPDVREVILDEYSKEIFEVDRDGFSGKFHDFLPLIAVEDRHKVTQLCNEGGSELEVDFELNIVTNSGLQKTILAKGMHFETQDEGCYFTGIFIDVTELRKVTGQKESADRNQQKLLTQAILDAQEKERNKISTALHDSICQLLYAIRFNLNHATKNSGFKLNMVQITGLLDQAITEIRNLSYDLTPSILRDFGFTVGIREMAERLSTGSFKISCNLHKETDLLAKDLQLYIFRIVQELINNTIKHAQATKAEILIGFDAGCVKIVVSDNGKGFDNKQVDIQREGSGLRGIRNRISLLKGTFNIVAEYGTRCEFSFDPNEFQG